MDTARHWYTRRVKEAIHIRLSKDNLNRDVGIELPESWMRCIRMHQHTTHKPKPPNRESSQRTQDDTLPGPPRGTTCCQLAAVVGTAPNVQGWKGEDIRMPCDIQEDPLAVFWLKEGIPGQQQRTAKATFADGEFPSSEERFDIDKNFSLVITDLEVADEGRYYCQVLLKNAQSFENTTIITISSMATGHTIEECADKSQSRQSRCIYQYLSNIPSFNLTCVVSGFKPNVSMVWTEESGERLNSVVSQQNTLSDGTYERFETITVSAKHGTEQTFTCVAIGDSLNGTSTREIIVLPPTVVGTAPNVQGWKGEDIRLPCDFQVEPLAVFWLKERISDQQQRTTKAEFIDGELESREERFDIDKNFSLVITNLEVADEGHYHCQVLLKNTQIVENTTIITIGSMATGHTIEECVDKSQSRQSRCTYQYTSNTPSFNLTCVVSGFKPNVSMLWTEESGERLNSVVSLQNTLSDGTYERFETITVSAKHGTEQIFMCVAAGDSLNGTSTREITVLPLSGKRNNLGLIIGLTIGVPVAIVILFLLVGKYLQNICPEYLPRKGCGWNPCWRRSNIPEIFEEDMEEEEIMLETPSLTKEQVQQCKEDLKAYYRVSRRKVTVDPLNFMERVELDEIFTNLSIIDRNSERKTPITYDDLVTNDENGNLSKRLLIQGEGGVGKTTLCAKIAWDWCQGRILQDLDMVLLIPLRDVTYKKSIGGIVKTYLSDSNTAKMNQIHDYIARNQSRILILFDGFDEFTGKLSEIDSSEIIRILGIEQYKSCKVIVTTRPWRTDEFMMDETIADVYTILSVDGFNEENLSTYIRRYFRIAEKDNLAESLISFMQENDVIRSSMASFPIFCAMLCLMWKDFSEERRTEMQHVQTFSMVFFEMISFLKEHYASKACANLQNQDILEHLNEAGMAIQEISEIALNGLLDRNLSFPENNFRKCLKAMKTCCRVGVLTIERDIITRERRRNLNISSLVESTVSFPHKLFQEYIAGVYIGYLFTNDRTKYDEVKHKLLSRPKEFRYVFYFASASGNELGLDIMKGLINCVARYFTSHPSYNKEDDTRDFCVDVAFECHTEEAARAVGKRWKRYELNYDSSDHTVSGLAFMMRKNQMKSLEMVDLKCGRTVSRDLAESMCSSSVLREVGIWDSQFHPDFFKILRDEASNCLIEDLTLFLNESDSGIPNQSSVGGDLAQWVCTMPRLFKLTLGSYYLPDSFLSTAVASASSCQIEDLTLGFHDSDNDLEKVPSVGGDLAQWVFALPRLSEFTLECSYLPDSFLSTAVASASSCQIEDLTVDFCDSDNDLEKEPSVGGDLAQWVFALPRLSKFSLKCSYLPVSFLSTAVASASSCQIEDLHLAFFGRRLGGDFAEWVFTLPRLSKFTLKCPYLPDSFLSTAVASASSCQPKPARLKPAQPSLGPAEPSAVKTQQGPALPIAQPSLGPAEPSATETQQGPAQPKPTQPRTSRA
ncbi:uncharacterized protein [Diadema setosum]|uniref:uncharacterized protein n=1 Tax=Diadema setosum TaxID=31175 RepID=UPI003B3AACD9